MRAAGSRNGEDAAITGKYTVCQAGKGIQGPCPWGPDPEGMEKSAQGSREGLGPRVPCEVGHREWKGRNRVGVPWSGRHDLGQLGMQQLALWPCPMPELLEQWGAVGKQGLETGV